MRKPTLIALALLVAVTSACSFQNKDEKEAQKITDAILANDMTPIKDDITPGKAPTRVMFAELSDELNQQGKLKSLKENPTCAPAMHCFDLVFEKSNYTEKFQRDENGKIVTFNVHMADATAPAH